MYKKYLLLVCLGVSLLAQDGEQNDIFTSNGYKTKNMQDEDTIHSMKKWRNANFGLKPHQPNYLLPYGYSTKEYRSYTPSDEYRNIEAELQVSLKIEAFRDLFGKDEIISLAYSHRSFWQAYTESSPFRETNYNPEFFVTFPVSFKETIPSLRSLSLGLGHLSNGQGNIERANIPGNSLYLQNRSRSVNYFYGVATLQHDALITDITLWMPSRHNGDLQDNPDIMDYVGYGNIKFRYFYHKHLFTLMSRLNFETKKGALEFTYSYPLGEDVYLFAKIFNGYGESLIDYNNDVTKFSIGFSFSR